MTVPSAPSLTTRPPLPTPTDRPGTDVVIFDSHCSMCTAQVARLARWDSGRRLSFLSLHDSAARALAPELTHEDLMREMVIVDARGGRHAGASAVRYLTRRLPRLWALAPFLHLPGSLPVWRWLYRLVARNRYRLGGKTVCDSDACSLHRG